MTALALTLSTSIPFFRLGELDVGLPIQAFGVIVAIGVLIGAGVLRRYAEWHGISDDHIRGITGWVTVTGFIGAHVFDVVAYQWADFMRDPVLILQIWKGISSYGGFLGGAFGFFFYVWWKQNDQNVRALGQPYRVFADVTLIGLLVAFSIGRLACTVVSDHVGAAVDPSKWYAALAMDYPRHLNLGHLAENYPGTSEYIRAWNLGLIEFLYLIPVNLFILWLAFRPAKPNGTTKDGKEKWIDRHAAGFVTVLIGVFYAPVRFFMDFLRPEETDPRYLGLTFAQWISIVAFAGAAAFALRVMKSGKPAEPVDRTAGETQRKLKLILKEDPRENDPKAVEKVKAEKAADKAAAPKAEVVKDGGKKKDRKGSETRPESDDDEELAKEALAAKAEDDAAATDEDKKAEKPATKKK
jgi:phosphatidylglycerol---prolipoprotein diacylglyceryl transferase